MRPCIAFRCTVMAAESLAVRHLDGALILDLCSKHLKEIRELLEAIEGDRILRRAMPELFPESRPRWAS